MGWRRLPARDRRADLVEYRDRLQLKIAEWDARMEIALDAVRADGCHDDYEFARNEYHWYCDRLDEVEEDIREVEEGRPAFYRPLSVEGQI